MGTPIQSIQTPLGKTVYLPIETQHAQSRGIGKNNLQEFEKQEFENSVNLAKILRSTDEPDLLSCRNTMNTSLNDLFIMLLYGRAKGARFQFCEDVPSENMDALKFLMRKKMDMINEFHGPTTYLQFDRELVYSIRKKEDPSLHVLTDDVLPLKFKQDGLYLVPTYSSRIKLIGAEFNLDCTKIF